MKNLNCLTNDIRYRTFKTIFRISSKRSTTHKGTYPFYINCLNGFCTASARYKHSEHCSSNGHVKVKMLSEKKNV